MADWTNRYVDNPDRFHRISGVHDIPRTAVTPDVSAAAQAEQAVDAGAGELMGFRWIVNSATDLAASTALADGAGCSVGSVGDSVLIQSSDAITRLDVLAFGSATGTGTFVAIHSATQAVALAEMVLWTFDSADNVRSARVSLSSSVATNTEAVLHCVGFTHGAK